MNQNNNKEDKLGPTKDKCENVENDDDNEMEGEDVEVIEVNPDQLAEGIFIHISIFFQLFSSLDI